MVAFGLYGKKRIANAEQNMDKDVIDELMGLHNDNTKSLKNNEFKREVKVMEIIMSTFDELSE